MIHAVAFAVYQALMGAAVLLALPVFALARRSEARERLGGGGPQDGAVRDRSIWIHAASLGEYEAARPLVEAWAGSRPIVVSCTNATARRRLRERLPKGVRARLAPIDFWPFVTRALARERPACLILVETEIWPAWLIAARRRGIPVAIVNARLSERRFPRYRFLAPALRPILRGLRVVGCRTAADWERWRAIGVQEDACRVWGNTKLVAGLPPSPHAPSQSRDRFVLVAGSVRPGEESILDLPARLDGVALRVVLAPRHLATLEHWESACLDRGLACRRWSLTGLAGDPSSDGCLLQTLRSRDSELPSVLLVDRMGILTTLYRSADAAFVGGTLVPIGGHNLYEPAREGVPVLFGPSIDEVRDVAESLIEEGGGRMVADADALAAAVRTLAEDSMERCRWGAAARRSAERLAGGASRTIEGLREAGIPPEDARP